MIQSYQLKEKKNPIYKEKKCQMIILTLVSYGLIIVTLVSTRPNLVNHYI